MVPAASGTIGPNLLCRGVVVAVMPGVSLLMCSDYRRTAPRRPPAAETQRPRPVRRGKIFWLRPEDPMGASRGRVSNETASARERATFVGVRRSIVLRAAFLASPVV